MYIRKFLLAALLLSAPVLTHASSISGDADSPIVGEEAVLLFNGNEQPLDELEALALSGESSDASRVVIRCRSSGLRTEYCGVGGRIRSVRLLRTMSTVPCIAGRTFGATSRYVWVRGGCRGEFLVDYQRHNGRDRDRDHGRDRDRH